MSHIGISRKANLLITRFLLWPCLFKAFHPVFTLTLFIFPCPAFLYVQTLTMEQGDTGYYLQAARSLVELSTGTFRMRR